MDRIKFEKFSTFIIILLCFQLQASLHVQSAAVPVQWNIATPQTNISMKATPAPYKTTPLTTGLRGKKLPQFSSSTAASVAGGRRTTLITSLSSDFNESVEGASYEGDEPLSDEVKLEIKVRNNKKRSSVIKNNDNANRKDDTKKKQNAKNGHKNNNDRLKNVDKQPKRAVKNNKNVKPGDVDSESDQTDLLTDLAQGYKTVYSKVAHWWKDLETSFSLAPSNKNEGNKKVKKDTQQPPKESKAKPAKKKDPPPKKKQQSQPWFDLEKFVMFLGAVVTVLDIFGIR